MLKSLLYIAFVLLTLAQLTAMNKSSGLNIYLFDIGVIILSLGGTIQLLLSKKFYLPLGFLLFLLFVFAASISLLVNSHYYQMPQLFIALFYLVRLFFYFLAGVVVFNMLVTKVIDADALVGMIVQSGVLVAVLGILQLFILPDFEVLDSSLGWDPHKSRLASTFFDPNFVSAYLVISFTLAFEKLISNKRSSTYTYGVLCIVFLIVSIILTFSRSGWLFLSVVVLMYGLYRTKWLLAVAAVLVFSAYFAVPRIQTRVSGITDPADSAHFRLISWNNTIEIIKDNVVFGVGYNAFRYVQQGYGFIEFGTFGGNSGAGSDASLLFVFATTGIIGLVLYLLCYVVFISKAYINRNNGYNFAILSVLLGLLLQSVFINSLFYPQIMFVMLLFFGLIESTSFRSPEDM